MGFYENCFGSLDLFLAEVCQRHWLVAVRTYPSFGRIRRELVHVDGSMAMVARTSVYQVLVAPFFRADVAVLAHVYRDENILFRKIPCEQTRFYRLHPFHRAAGYRIIVSSFEDALSE